MTETVRDIVLRPEEPLNTLPGKAAKKLGISAKDITFWRILRRSLDARKKNNIHYICSVEISTEPCYCGPVSAPSAARISGYSGPRPVIVGFGPAGMFAGLTLARAGLRPLILERGECVEARTAAVDLFRKTGVLNPESNAQFGEGGAGTFSDGKLNTGTHDSRIYPVLQDFVRHGAQESVLYDAKPHIGTDILVHVVRNIREEILSLGGEIRFETRADGLVLDGTQLRGVSVSCRGISSVIPCRELLLATGHSARDTLESLHALGVPMERKAFSMGVRIEHLQSRINRTQYGSVHPHLPAADYSLSVHLPDGESAYTFCMCPGGYVFSASSEPGGICTNGMSYSGRSGTNANSALLVTLKPEDFPGDSLLSGMYWQREIERKAYEYGAASGPYFAPCQTVGDFLQHIPSTGPGTVLPTYLPGVHWGDLHAVLPDRITAVLEKAIPALNCRLPGFSDPDAVLTAPETRSSSPVRILRDRNCESAVTGLFPCGEGAGYAGGITSAAVDGIRCAEAVIQKIAASL